MGRVFHYADGSGRICAPAANGRLKTHYRQNEGVVSQSVPGTFWLGIPGDRLIHVLGPTGVGKTEYQNLAKFLFGSEENLISWICQNSWSGIPSVGWWALLRVMWGMKRR